MRDRDRAAPSNSTGVRRASRLLAGAFSAAFATALVASPPSAGKDPSVTIADYNFSPQTVTLSVGETVTWTNSGPRDHTVTADDQSFDSGPLGVHDAFANVFDQAGTFTYRCAIHPTKMGGTVIVEAAAATPTPVGTLPPTPPPGTRPANLATPTLVTEPPATTQPSANGTARPTPSQGPSSPLEGGTAALIVGVGAVLILGLRVVSGWRRRRGRRG